MTVYTRAGAAYQAGAPVGASWNVAQSTSDEQQASTAGAAFGLASANAGYQPGFQAQRTRNLEPTDQGAAGQARSASVGSAATSALFWLNTPVRYVGDYIETRERVATALSRSDLSFGERARLTLGAATGVFQFLDPAFRREFDLAQQAQSSPGQTMWLGLKAQYAPDELASRENPFDLLDDPTRMSDREEYFGSGWAKWTSGVIDTGVNLGLDPTIVAGKTVGVARAARNAIKLSDVNAVASGAANLTRGGRRLQMFVDNIVDASETARNMPGGYATIAANPALAQAADSGAIPYALSRLDNVADDAERMALKKDVLFAGMGHRGSLARLADYDKFLELEVRALNGPNQEFARSALLLRTDQDYLTSLRQAHEDDWMDELVGAYSTQVREIRDGLERAGRVGNPAALSGDELAATSGAGGLNTLPDSVRANATRYNPGEVMGVARILNHGLGLTPVHVLWGRKIPQVIALDADDAYQSFASAVMRTAGRAPSRANLDDTMRSFLDRFSQTFGASDAAAARAQRRKIVDEFTHEADRRLVAKYGAGDPRKEHLVREFLREVRTRRTAEMVNVKERAQRAIDLENDSMWIVGNDGILVADPRAIHGALGESAVPFAGTQTQSFASIPDYAMVEKFVRDKTREGWAGWATVKKDGVVEWSTELLTGADQLWKFAALFRPGYPVRNLVDTQSRNLAMLGAFDMLGYAGRGIRNMRLNYSKVPAAVADRAFAVAGARTRIAQIDDMLAQNADVFAGRGAVQTLDSSTVMARTVTATELREERQRLLAEVADGERFINDADNLSSPKTVRLKDTPLARHIGMDGDRPVFRSVSDAKRAISSIDAADSVAGLVMADASKRLRYLRASGQWETVAPSHPGWASGYLDMVNKRVRNDRGLMMLLAGADNAAVRSWYTTTAEGRAIWGGLAGRYGDDVDSFIATQRQQLDLLVPTGPARSAVLGGEVTEGMLDDMFAGATKPAVPFEMLDGNVPNGGLDWAVGWFNRTRKAWFKYAGEMPEETLGRLPFYVSRKEGHIDRLWPKMADGTDAVLVKSQIDELYSQADVLARRDVGRYLFDTAQRSNVAAHLRFLSPFYMAWSDTMRKWARIMGYHPQALGYGTQVVTSLNSAFTVVDEEGNRIRRDGAVLDADGNVVRWTSNPFDGYIVVPLPQGIANWMGADDNVKISKSALNVTFQGEPFWLPSTGPLVTIPTNALATRVFPEFASTPLGKYLLPFGPEADIKSQVLPAWVRNANSLMNAEMGAHGESRLAQTYAMILASKENEIRRGEADPMTQGEIMDYADNATRNWWLMRFFSNWLGASAQPQSKLEFYVQEYRRFRREYGADADEKFMAQYPDYYEATLSLSVNETGLTATDDTWAAAEKYATDIDRNKRYGWMYVGAANLAPGFSKGVYTAQQARGWRTVKDPVQAYTDVQVSRGWTDYNRVADAIQQQLEQRVAAGGSGSMSARANEDLAQIKREFVAELKASNPEWANEFEQGGTAASVNAFFRAAYTAQADNPELAQRSDFQVLNDYLEVRDAIRQQLDARGLATVDSAGAEDLAEIWGEFTTKLVASDIGFEQMWTRAGLERDNIGRG